jgi:hypothetical protein
MSNNDLGKRKFSTFNLNKQNNILDFLKQRAGLRLAKPSQRKREKLRTVN